ncbi:hypothetical protein CMUS01_11419, partial [Colletotrichum musicola]
GGVIGDPARDEAEKTTAKHLEA